MHRLIYSKSRINEQQLFGREYLEKISPLQGKLFGSGIITDTLKTPLEIGLYKALDIKHRVSEDTFNIIMYWFYIVEPGAVNELMLQKLQDNPALRMHGEIDGDPARIFKLSDNWEEEWIVAELIAQRKSGSIYSDNTKSTIYKRFGVEYGGKLLRKASNMLHLGQKELNNHYVNMQINSYTTLKAVCSKAVELQIKNNMLAKD